MKQPAEDLVEDIRQCRVCRDAPRGLPLPDEPRPVLQFSPTARILIAGQAPGNLARKTGRPFTDPSGDTLREWLGIDSAVFYDPTRIAIVPMGFCFPGTAPRGGDFPPRPECAPQWRAKVLSLLEDIELVCLVGRYALDWHLPEHRKTPLAELVRTGPHFRQDRNVPHWPLPHPSWRTRSWRKRNLWFEETLLPELRLAIAATLHSNG